MQSILVFAPSSYPLGGVQTWLDYLLPGLQNRGLNIQLALTSGQHQGFHSYLKFHPKLASVPVHELKPKANSAFERRECIKSMITKLQPNLCLVVNVADVYEAVNELRKARASATKVVSTLHGIHAGMLSTMRRYQ